jgi:hypothetical protein
MHAYYLSATDFFTKSILIASGDDLPAIKAIAKRLNRCEWIISDLTDRVVLRSVKPKQEGEQA